MAITLKTPPTLIGETALTLKHTDEAGTVIGPFAVTEEGETGVYTHTRTIGQMPVGDWISQLFRDGIHWASYATRVVADGVDVVVAATVDELKNMATNQTEHDATQVAIAAISLTGSGARTVTITVTDGEDPLASVLARVTSGVNTFTRPTNGSGVVVFNLDDGTWVVSLTKGGYSYSGSSIVVDGTETRTLAMTAVVAATPAPAGLCNVLFSSLRGGVAVAGARCVVNLEDQLSMVPQGVQMQIVMDVTTDSLGDGLLTLPWSSAILFGSGVYRIRVTDPATGLECHNRRFTVPDLASANLSDLPMST